MAHFFPVRNASTIPVMSSFWYGLKELVGKLLSTSLAVSSEESFRIPELEWSGLRDFFLSRLCGSSPGKPSASMMRERAPHLRHLVCPGGT